MWMEGLQITVRNIKMTFHGRSHFKCIFLHLKIYQYNIIYIFFFSVFRQMEWEQFWRNEDRQLAALHQGKKKKK